MLLGILQAELIIDGARSLKDKRRVVKSIKDRLHRDHLVSVAEVGPQDVWNLAVLGIAAVSSDGRRLAATLDKIAAKLSSLDDARLADLSRQVLVPDSAAGDLDASGEPLWTESERRGEAAA